jgi:hypothetical protein
MKYWPAVLAAVFAMTGSLYGQQRVRGHVWLPPASGATVLSTQLHAQAVRAVAMGDLLESAAIARRINLESDRIAMENSIQWVETYFERRKLNREYRDAERLNYEESQLQIGRAKHRNIMYARPPGDASDEINFMMNRMVADPDAYRSIFLGDLRSLQKMDLPLTPNDLSHILLKQTGGSGGALILRPTDPQLVSEHWPTIFVRPEFDELRRGYDQVRAKALAEVRTSGQLSVLTLEEVQAALHQLQQKFEDVYQWKRMKGTVDIATFSHFREAGEKFFRAQAGGTLRAFAMNDPDSYSGDLRFDGDTLIDLLRHCSQYNLLFAQAAPGDEPTYARLYQQVRQLYIEFIPDQPSY